MEGGYQLILSPAASSSSFMDRMSIYHCLEGMISTEVPHRSWTETVWVMGSVFSSRPFSSSRRMISFRAFFTCIPPTKGTPAAIMPSGITTFL